MTTPLPTASNPFGLPESGTAWVVSTASGAALQGINAAGQAYIQGLAGTGTAPVLAAGAGAGVGASISAQLGHDLGGSFNLLTAGTPAAGALATVTFGTALTAAPAAIIVTCWDITGAAAVAVGPTSIANTGFTVSTGATATTAHHLLVAYFVLYA